MTEPELVAARGRDLCGDGGELGGSGDAVEAGVGGVGVEAEGGAGAGEAGVQSGEVVGGCKNRCEERW